MKPAGEIDGLLIFETTHQSVEESTSGAETKKTFEVFTRDRSIRTTDKAFRAFNRWVGAFARYDAYFNQPKQISFQSDPKTSGNHWTAEITWGPVSGRNEDRSLRPFDLHYDLRFSTKGGRQVRKVAYAQKTLVGGEWVDDVTRLVGAEGEGIEVDAPAQAFQVRDRYPYVWLSDERRAKIAAWTGQTVNGAEFFGYPPGSVRFLGMDTSLVKVFEGDWGEIDGIPYQLPTFYWDATFDFAAQGARDELTETGGTLRIDPWVHLWVDTEEADFTDENDETYSGIRVRRYHAAQIYMPADYNELF